MKLLSTLLKHKIFTALVVALIGALVNLGYQWYQQPRIIFDSSYSYSKVGRSVIGSMQLTNLGRNVEEGLTIRIETPIESEDYVTVLVNGVPTEQEITLRPDFTDVVINKLYPDDDLLISFAPQYTDMTSFTAWAFGRNMNKSRYEYLLWKAEWWEFDSTQKGFIMVMAALGVVGGYLLCKSKHRRKK